MVTATVNCTPRKAWRASTTGSKTPSVYVLVEFLFQTLQAFGVFSDSPDVFLKDDLLRRCGTDHFGEPAQVGRAPISPAHITDILPKQEGFKTQIGRFEIAHGIFACPAQVADGLILDFRDIHHGEVPERASLANCMASRWSVLTRSPAFLGISEGATTQQS